MMNANLKSFRQATGRLNGLDYIAILTKISAILLGGGSYLTSLYGACLYVSNNLPAAFLLSTGFQIGIFVFSHGAAKVADIRREKISKLIRVLAFLPCLGFSSYMSTLGTYAVLRPTIEVGNQMAVLRSKLHDSANNLDQIQTAALGYVNDKMDEIGEQIDSQKKRLQRSHKPYSRAAAQRELDRLNFKAHELDQARNTINGVDPIGETMPSGIDEARVKIDAAKANASKILASMPAEFREGVQLPQLSADQPPPNDIQDSYFQELQHSSPSAIFCLVFALLLDCTPIMIIRSRIPTPVLPERVRKVRRYFKGMRAALTEPLDLYPQTLRLVVDGFPSLTINLDLGSEDRELYLEGLTAHFDYLEKRISEEVGEAVTIAGLRTSMGMELLPDLPLRAQLDADNTIYLRTEAIKERANT